MGSCPAFAEASNVVWVKGGNRRNLPQSFGLLRKPRHRPRV